MLKFIRRFITASVVALNLLLCLAAIVAAAPGSITNLIANPTSTTIILSWTKATASNSTVIRYSTTAFPSTPASGTSAYNGTSYQAEVTGLTAGQVYFFSAWGYDGSDYSANATQIVMSTLAVDIPTGEEPDSSINIPLPTLPANINQTPDPSGLNLEPFTGMITWFNEAEGGFGMPEGNAWSTVYIFGMVSFGSLTYWKVRQFFIAFGIVFVASVIGVGLELVQGYVPVFLGIIGAGVWAIEKYLQ